MSTPIDDFPQNPEPLPDAGASGFVLNNDTSEFTVREKLTAGAITLTGLGNSGQRTITSATPLKFITPSVEMLSNFNIIGDGTTSVGLYANNNTELYLGGGSLTEIQGDATVRAVAADVELVSNDIKIGTGSGGFATISGVTDQPVMLYTSTTASVNANQTELYSDTVILGKGLDAVGRSTVTSRANVPLDISCPDLSLLSNSVKVGTGSGPTAVITSKPGQEIFIGQNGQQVLPDGGVNNRSGIYMNSASAGIYGGDAVNNVIVDNTGVIGSNFVDNLNGGFGGFISQTREGENLFALPANDIIHNGAITGNNVTFLLGGQRYHRIWTRPGWYELFTQNITGTDQPIGMTVKRAGLYKITWCCNSSSEAKLTVFRPGVNRFLLDGTTVNNTPNITIEFLQADDTLGMAFTGGATCIAAGTYMLIERVAGIPGTFVGTGRGGVSTSTNYR